MFEDGYHRTLQIRLAANRQTQQTGLNSLGVPRSKYRYDAVARMKSCLERLENNSKLLDFHLRELRERIKTRYAVQFMLDREFFADKSKELTERVELRTIEI